MTEDTSTEHITSDHAATDDGVPSADHVTGASGSPSVVSDSSTRNSSTRNNVADGAEQTPHAEPDPRLLRIAESLDDALRFLGRRARGEYEVDDYGFDPELADAVLLRTLRVLYHQWLRVEVRGAENIPEGGALLVSNHSGAVGWDALMVTVAVHDELTPSRRLRMLGADVVFDTPWFSAMARKLGATLASHQDASRLLHQGELVGVWPEGFKGTGKGFSERYKLQRFGRGGFVAAAMEANVPIIPCSVVGAEESTPMFGNLRLMAKLLGWPYAPVTPTWPLLGPIGLLPLPAKWIIDFGTPIDTEGLHDAAVEDPTVVLTMMEHVRSTIQETLYELLAQRQSVFGFTKD